MQQLMRVLQRNWWNEERPARTETTFVLTLVLVAAIAAGSGLASVVSGSFADASAAISTSHVTSIVK